MKPFIIFLLLLLPALASAQKEGYLKTKDIIYYGALHGLEKPRSNEVVFEFNNGNKKSFSPEEALEFGLSDGRKWISRDYKGKKQFFEALVEGKASLLYLKEEKKGEYLLLKEDDIFDMQAEEGTANYYKDVLLSTLADCYLTEKTIKMAKYKAANLRYFVSQANSCLKEPFPRFRIGPAVGVRLYKNVIESKFFPAEPEKNVALAFGAIIEIPISYHPQILLLTQPMVAQYSFTASNSNYSATTATTSYNTHYLKHTDLDLPLLLKYRFAKYKLSPYIQAGPSLQLGLSTKSYSISDKVQFINGQYTTIEADIYVDTDALSNRYLGAMAGAGLEIPLKNYMTALVGANFSIYTADVDTGSNRKTYPDLFVAITF